MPSHMSDIDIDEEIAAADDELEDYGAGPRVSRFTSNLAHLAEAGQNLYAKYSPMEDAMDHGGLRTQAQIDDYAEEETLIPLEEDLMDELDEDDDFGMAPRHVKRGRRRARRRHRRAHQRQMARRGARAYGAAPAYTAEKIWVLDQIMGPRPADPTLKSKAVRIVFPSVVIADPNADEDTVRITVRTPGPGAPEQDMQAYYMVNEHQERKMQWMRMAGAVGGLGVMAAASRINEYDRGWRQFLFGAGAACVGWNAFEFMSVRNAATLQASGLRGAFVREGSSNWHGW